MVRIAALLVALLQAAPAECKRSDFKSFDDFVDCQTRQLPAEQKVAPRESVYTPAPPPPKPRYTPRQERELEEYTVKRDRNYKGFIGMLSTGLVLGAGGLITGAIGLAMREEAERTDDGGPMCSIGKRCGDACIEVTDTCHLDQGGSLGPITPAGRRVALAGGGILLAGVGFLIGAALFKREADYWQWELDRIRF